MKILEIMYDSEYSCMGNLLDGHLCFLLMQNDLFPGAARFLTKWANLFYNAKIQLHWYMLWSLLFKKKKKKRKRVWVFQEFFVCPY